ncbi:MAG: response regulator [Candidatus Rokuibacteriota bacterium]|nr:MAG: response regulator [Candidatus Rokubacteria bacterium]
MAISGKGVRPPTLDDIPSVTTLPGARLAGLRLPPVHILVIEDHDDTRDVLDMLLRTEGYEVTLAVDGQDGLEKYRQRPPDIVLVDIFMPRKNGIDTIRELTRDFPNSVCIAMSADGDSMRRNALEFAREAGARLTLRKPIEPWVLLRTLEGVVAGRRSLTRLTAAS